MGCPDCPAVETLQTGKLFCRMKNIMVSPHRACNRMIKTTKNEINAKKESYSVWKGTDNPIADAMNYLRFCYDNWI